MLAVPLWGTRPVRWTPLYSRHPYAKNISVIRIPMLAKKYPCKVNALVRWTPIWGRYPYNEGHLYNAHIRSGEILPQVAKTLTENWFLFLETRACEFSRLSSLHAAKERAVFVGLGTIVLITILCPPFWSCRNLPASRMPWARVAPNLAMTSSCLSEITLAKISRNLAILGHESSVCWIRTKELAIKAP